MEKEEEQGGDKFFDYEVNGKYNWELIGKPMKYPGEHPAVLTPEMLKEAKASLSIMPSYPTSSPAKKDKKTVTKKLSYEEKVQAFPAIGGALTGCNCSDCERKRKDVGSDAGEIKPLVEITIPSGEEWIGKYFPKGSVIVGEILGIGSPRKIKSLARQHDNTVENIPDVTSVTWCAACVLSIDHNVICSCGHIWMQHFGHDCHNCKTDQCYPVATVTGHWVASPGLAKFKIKGCACSYCSQKVSKTRVTRLRIRQPVKKPTKGRVVNEIAKEYGLDPNLILVEAAADFYLLIEMGAMQPLDGQADEEFRGVTARLAEQLCLYLELACLGEFRHASDGYDSVWLSGYEVTEKRKASIVKFSKYLGRRIRIEVGGVEGRLDSRMAAWKSWETVHKRYKGEAYLLMIEGFQGFSWGRGDEKKGCNIGGPKWAACIETALAYRNGMPAAVFVDQALSLRHNGNIAYSKFFDVRGLDNVIDWAFRGDTRNIQHYATDKVRGLWQVWKKEKGGGRRRVKAKA